MQLVLVTLRAVATVFVVQAFGVALVRAGILTRDVISGLSSLVQNFLLPASIFVRMGGIMTMELLREMWLLPVVYLLMILANLLVAYTLLLPLSGSPDWFQPWFTLTVSFPNMVAIPLIFVREICQQVTFVEDGVALDANECLAQGELFLFFAGQLVTLSFWIIGPEMVAQHDAAAPARNELTSQTVNNRANGSKAAYTRVACEEDLEEFSLADQAKSTSRGANVQAAADAEADDQEHENTPPAADLDSSNINRRGDLHDNLAALEKDLDGSDCDDDQNSILDESQEPTTPRETSFLQKCATTCKRVLLRPPTLAQLVAIPIALVPVLRSAVFGKASILQPATSALITMSFAMVPSLNLVVSGSLGLSFFEPKDESRPPLFSIIPARALAVLLLGRMVLLPLASFGFLSWLQPRLFADTENSLMMAVMFMSVCTPTSNNSVVLLTMSKQPDAADALALVIMGQYIVGMFSMTAFLVLSFRHLDI